MRRRAASGLILFALASLARAEEGPADLPVFRLDPGDVVRAVARADGPPLEGRGVLHVLLTGPKRREFASFTEGHVGQKVEVVVCGARVGTPTVKRKVDEPVLDIAYPALGAAAEAAKALTAKPVSGAAPAAPLPTPN